MCFEVVGYGGLSVIFVWKRSVGWRFYCGSEGVVVLGLVSIVRVC